MKRIKSEPKLTQQQIIDRMIQDTAHYLTNDYGYQPFVSLNSKNLPTLQAMVKRGILAYESPYTDSSFILTDKAIAQHSEAIRQAAVKRLSEELDRSRVWFEQALERGRLEYWLRFCAADKTMRHWTNTSDFYFIDWDFTDNVGRTHSLNFNYQHDCETTRESELQALEQSMAKAEIARIPRVEFCAIR